jgi:hypothetical protein
MDPQGSIFFALALPDPRQVSLAVKTTTPMRFSRT